MFNDTCFTSQALVRLYIGLKTLNSNDVENRGMPVYEGPRFEDIADTFKLLANELPACRKLLEVTENHDQLAKNLGKHYFEVHVNFCCALDPSSS